MSYLTERADAAKDIQEACSSRLCTLRTAEAIPAVGETPAVPAVEYRVYAVEFPYSIGVRDGTSVKTGDRRFYVAALDSSGAAIPTPTPAHRFYTGTTAPAKLLTIVGNNPLQPDGVPILHEVQCRG